MLGSLIFCVAADRHPPRSGLDPIWTLNCKVLMAFRAQSWVNPEREGGGHSRSKLVEVHPDCHLYAFGARSADCLARKS